jgi:hypothetical protein
LFYCKNTTHEKCPNPTPGVWNFAMVLMASLVPKDVLLNKSVAGGLAAFTAPLVRVVDALVVGLYKLNVECSLP